jgi:ABC-type transporter Mla subunit MlaD
MSTQTNYFRLGLFVIIGIVLGVAGVIIFGGLQLFPDPMLKVETYFEESVQGLMEGSKIKMRGVTIGTIEEIGFVASSYPLSDELDIKYGRWILVRASIDPQAFEGQSVRELAALIPARIEAGLRVRMASSGLTGGKFIEVDSLDPERFPAFEPPWEPRDTYVPSARGVISAIVSSVDHIVEQIKDLDVKKVLTDVDNLILTADQAIQGADLPGLGARAETLIDNVDGIIKGEDVRQTLANLREASESAKLMMADAQELFAGEKMSGTVDNLAASGEHIRQATERLPTVIGRLDRAILNLDRVITSESEDMQELIMELRITVQNLRELTDLAKEYPASVLFGQEPPESKPEEKP